MGGRVVVLCLLFAVVALGQQPAKPREPTDPAAVEKAVRRRVETWIRERQPDKLTCPKCKEPKYGDPPCELCKGTRMNALRLDNAMWAFLPPSWRKTRKKADVLKEWLSADWIMIQGGEIQEVEVGRDSCWVTLGQERRDVFGTADRRVWDAWASEGGLFFLDVGTEAAEQLVKHDWFVLGTFSMRTFSLEVERQHVSEEAEGKTDLDRQKAAEARRLWEAAMQERVIADMARFQNVARSRDGAGLEVQLVNGPTVISYLTTPPKGTDLQALELRYSGIRQGTPVVFRGRPFSWRRGGAYSRLEGLTLIDGDVTEAPTAAPPKKG